MGGKRIHRGPRGGQYTITPTGRKAYIARPQQSGGVPQMGDEVYAFLADHVIARVVRRNLTVTNVQIIYDAMNELSSSGSFHIMLLYNYDDEDEHTNVFFLDTNLVLQACYIEQRRKNNEHITREQERLLNDFVAMASSAFTASVKVVAAH